MDRETLGALMRRVDYYIVKRVREIVGDGKNAARETGYYIKLYDVSASVVRDFPYDEDGLSAALQESATGDTVWVPGGTITLTAAVTVPAGVTLKGDGIDRTKITATANLQNLITLGAASSIELMTVTFTSSSAAESKAVFLQESSIRNVKIIKSETGGGSPNWGVEGDLYSSATEKLCSAENVWVYVSETSGAGINHRAINFDIENASPGVIVKNITGVVDITNANQDGYGIFLDGETANEIYAYNIYGSCVSASATSTVYGIQAGYSHIWNAQGIAKCDGIFANGILIWNSHMYNSRGEGELTAAGANDAYGIDADDSTLTNCIGTGAGAGGGATIYGITTNDVVNLYSTVGDGDTADIVGGGPGDTLNIYGVQYDTISDPNGTITLLAGDLMGPWTTDSNVVNLNTDTDTVTIGSLTGGGKLFVDGDADEVQLQVQAHSTQTNNIVEIQNSGGTPQIYINESYQLGIGVDPTHALRVAGDTYYAFSTTSAIATYGNSLFATSTGTGELYSIYGRARRVNVNGVSNGVNGMWYLASTFNSSANNITTTYNRGGIFQNEYYLSSSGNVTINNGLGLGIAAPSITKSGGGTLLITNQYGILISNQGSVYATNVHGIYILDQTNGTSTNYALYTNAGTVRFGADLVALPDEITATDAGVAASVDTVNTEVTTNGDEDLDEVTLVNGVSGQIKHIYCVVEGHANDTWKITPATMCGGTEITFAGVGLGCTLVYADNEGWVVTANNGGTIT
jgi:hypothetical protein